MGMRIIDINGGNSVETHTDSFKITGCLFFDTKAEAIASTEPAKYGAGTVVYTGDWKVGIVLTTGTISWKE